MNTRSIKYANPKEDALQIEVDRAVTLSMEDRFREYCNTIVALYAMSEIDVLNYPIKKVIAYSNEE